VACRAPRMPGRPSERHRVKVLLRAAGLHTVCEEARCPNIAACFGAGTATFLILGDACTRACRFCGVGTSRQPAPPDPDEPARVGRAVAELGLEHAVITSVTRDDLDDGGAGKFAGCIREVRRCSPGTTVEVLVPDFGGARTSLDAVLDATPEVLNHNLETVPRLYPRARPGAGFERSLDVLQQAAGRGNGATLVKSGLMVGLGETREEILAVLERMRQAGCGAVTIGQYLQPNRSCLEVVRRVTDEEFGFYREAAEALGMLVESGPLVRSSFHAREMYIKWKASRS